MSKVQAHQHNTGAHLWPKVRPGHVQDHRITTPGPSRRAWASGLVTSFLLFCQPSRSPSGNDGEVTLRAPKPQEVSHAAVGFRARPQADKSAVAPEAHPNTQTAPHPYG